ncbi:MAG TPA: GGDEF domain-containing protein [bacterium]|nr:GGDEF domain-containing protein [bacterium]
MFDHLSKYEKITIPVRALVWVIIAGVGFTGLAGPLGLRGDLITALLSWVLLSSTLFLQTKKNFRLLSMAITCVDTVLLMLIVWNTGKTSSVFAYALPLLAVPAGLFVGSIFSVVIVFCVSGFFFFIMLQTYMTDFYLDMFWVEYFLLTLVITMFMQARQEMKKARIVYAELERLEKQHERRIVELEQSLSEQKIVDDVTGLKNYRYFRERLLEEIARATRQKYKFSLCVMSIDTLSEFEKEFGGHERDVALARVTRQLRKAVRDTDQLSRHSKDQFMILLPGTEPRQSIVPAKRIMSLLAKINFGPHNNFTFNPCFGISGFPDDARDLPGLVGLAMSALERSQYRGNGHVTLASALYRR